MVSGTGNSGSVGSFSYEKFENPRYGNGPSGVSYLSPELCHDSTLFSRRELEAQAAVERGAVESAYLSNGPALYVDGLVGREPLQGSTCFHRVCASLGVLVPRGTCRVEDLRDKVLLELQSAAKFAKVYYEYTSVDHRGNHVTLVAPSVNSARIELLSPDGSGRVVPTQDNKVVGVTSLVQFFNKSNQFSKIMFFSGEQDTERFGSDVVAGPQQLPSTSPGLSFARNGGRPSTAGGGGPREQSISDPGARHGTANITSGVVRPRRRVVASKSKVNITGHVTKSYVASSGVQFNNLNEIFLDSISRDYAQEILEQLFEAWGVDSSDPDALKYAEDLVWAFLIATTASNKASYNKEFDIPHKTTSVVVNFDVMSRLLAEGHGITRRQFARGVADDMHRYIREPENLHLLPRLADRVGCDPQMAALAFDGSTHCTGLTSAELSFTKLLEKRNLFEDDSVLADGASQRLMQGMSSGPRSIISR